MSKKKRAIKKRQEKVAQNRLETLLLLLVLFVLAVLPLVVYGKMITLEGSALELWGVRSVIDFFSYYKMLLFLVATGSASLLFTVYMIKHTERLKRTNLYVPIIAFSFLVLFSALLAEHKEIALVGFFERYEGLFVLLGYMLFFCIAFNIFNREEQIRRLFLALGISAVVIGTIGLFQYLGLDPFQAELGRQLLLPSRYSYLADQLIFTLEETVIYSTLYHSNYLGKYMAMIIPLSATMFIFCKKNYGKLVLGFIILLMFVNLLGSKSRGGFLGLILAFLLLAIISRRKLIHNWRYCLISFAVASTLFLLMNFYSQGVLLDRALSVTYDPRVTVNPEGLEDIMIEGNRVKIVTQEEELVLVNRGDGISFLDRRGDVLDFVQEKNEILFSAEEYSEYQVTIWSYQERPLIEVNKNNLQLVFLVKEDGFSFFNHRSEEVEIQPVESWGFAGMEALGSARGYIWSRSLPLLKKTIIIGLGPDTFALHFPQHDYVGKLKAYGTMNIIVDKPHNLYLQTAINTGAASLVAKLILFAYYIASSIKLYFVNRFDDYFSIYGAAIFTAVCGYLTAGLFNDSVISVAPVFWVLLGVGFSINRRLEREKQEIILA